MQHYFDSIKPYLILSLAAWLLAFSAIEFYTIAWGSGIWFGQFSFKWALAFLFFTLFCILSLGAVVRFLWSPAGPSAQASRISGIRERLGFVRWLLVIFTLIAPAYLLQYTFYGAVLYRPYLRIFLWVLAALIVGMLLTRGVARILSWPALLAALILSSGVFNFIAPLGSVTSYPFSLGWSEGNRLWDYSVLFGRGLYDYPGSGQIPVLLDIGRQFVGGIPFLLPGLTIWQARLWVALTNVVPYLVLGWVVFRLPRKYFVHAFLAGIWAFTFVRQGPIHPPLLLSAIAVGLAWGQSLWIAVPLVLVSSYFAEASRFTWMFAPGMWAAMLEFSGASSPEGAFGRRNWIRAVTVGVAGLLGGYVGPRIVPMARGWIASSGAQPAAPPAELVAAAGEGITAPLISPETFVQPMIWYRLFPNATYEYGILAGLLIAAAPLIAVLIYLAATRRWPLNGWQKLGVILPLLAFLVVGLIVSVKIGGGGDLHNMDMFLIGVLFAAALAWRNGGREWVIDAAASPVWVRILVLLLIIIPGYQPFMSLAPIAIADDLSAVRTLADIPPEGPFPQSLPSEEDTTEALERIRREVAEAAATGEVLFMDQRQLLTFGYIEGVTLIPEYDKKVLINEAMSGHAQYFESFYRDLAAQRFALIVSNPLHMRIQTQTDDFGEENNAWVRWVSTPILCFYEPAVTLKKVTVQLLEPRQDILDCDQLMPGFQAE